MYRIFERQFMADSSPRDSGEKLSRDDLSGDWQEHLCTGSAEHSPPAQWNKGKIVGQKAPLKLKDIWAIRVRLQMEHRTRELALFNLGLDSKLRGCDLVALRVRDVCHGDAVASRAIVIQHKGGNPVQFEITAAMREAVAAWIKMAGLRGDDSLFPSRMRAYPHLGTRQYVRIVRGWVEEIGLDGHADAVAHRLCFHPAGGCTTYSVCGLDADRRHRSDAEQRQPKLFDILLSVRLAMVWPARQRIFTLCRA